MRLGILGGMGPMATSDFFKKVIDLTHATKDQEHIHVLIDNNTEIPDRTNFILNHGENPGREMIRSAIKLEMMGADVLVMPCNTAHYFYSDIDEFTDIPVINMIEETAHYVLEKMPDQKQFLLLATTGTYESKVYKKVFESNGLSLVEPDENGKNEVMKWIYDVKAGVCDYRENDISAAIDQFSLGTDIPVILGCTELPVLIQMLNIKGKFIDPTNVLASKCVAYSLEA